MQREIMRKEHHLMPSPETYIQILNDLDFKNTDHEFQVIDKYFFDTTYLELYQKNAMLYLKNVQKCSSLALLVQQDENEFENLFLSPYCIEDKNKLFDIGGARIDNSSFKNVLMSKTDSQPVAFLGKVMTKRLIRQYYGALIKIDINFFPKKQVDHEISFCVFDDKKEKEVASIAYFFKNAYELTAVQNKYQRLVRSILYS